MNRHEGMTEAQIEKLWPSDLMGQARDEATRIDEAFERWADSFALIDDLRELRDELATTREEIANGHPGGATPDQLGCLYAVQARMAEIERGQTVTWRSKDSRDLLIEFTQAIIELTRWERTVEEAGREAEYWEGLTGSRAKGMLEKTTEREEEAEHELARLEDVVERMHVVMVERMEFVPDIPPMVSTPGPDA